MAKGYCPVCEELIGISPTGERRHASRGTDTWWRLDLHRTKDKPEICEGSGGKI